MVQLIFWVFIAFLGVHIHGADEFSFVIKKEDSFEHILALCQSHITQEQLLQKITYKADVRFDQQEFDYLVGLAEGSRVTALDLARALFYLFAKNKFESIQVLCQPDLVGVHIHLAIEAFWTLARLKVHGIMMGKDTYKQLYLMDVADTFDHDAHGHSLNKIKEYLHDQGYCNGEVTSSMVHNSNNKSIVVHLYIDKGKRFTIGTNELEIIWDDVDGDQGDLIRRQLSKHFFRTFSGRVFSRELLNKHATSIKDYLAQRGYMHVDIHIVEKRNPTTHHMDLVWQLHLYTKRQFVFFGNHFFSSAQLLSAIMKFGRFCWMLPATMLTQELQKMYYRSGFWQAEIQAQEEQGRSFFVIKEGERTRISAIQIKNSNFFSQELLRKRCCGQLSKKGYFDHELVQRALESITQKYVKAGFVECKIVGYDFIKQDDSSYVIVITIQEGSRFFFGTNTGGLESELEGPLAHGVVHGVPFSMALVYEHKQWLEKQLQSKGYEHPTVTYELIYTDHNTVDVSWHIDRGPEPLQFGKTIVLGSYPVSNKMLLSALQYKQSDLWNQEYIKQSFLRLKECNVFDTLSLTPLRDPTDPGKKMVLLKAYPDEPFELRLRLGAEMQYVKKFQTIDGLTYKVGSTFMMKNPFERGDILRFDVDLAGSHREVVGTYNIPLAFPTPAYAQARAYSIKQDHPGFIGSNKNIYTIDQNGFLGALNKKYHWADVGANLGFEWMKTTMSDDEASTRRMALELAHAINFEPRLLGKLVPYVFFEPTAFIDLLDNKIDPQRGSLSLFSLKAMIPLQPKFSAGAFVRMLVEQSFFVPIKYAVLAARIRFGHIFNQLFSQIMPSERFYLGGPNSLRGYTTDLAPPLGSFVDDEGKVLLVPRGGSSMINGNVELRARLTKSVGAVLFQDLGVLSADRFADIKAHHVLAATGFGVRYFTPIGPLRFDLGFNWRKAYPTQSRVAWFLNFGHAF